MVPLGQKAQTNSDTFVPIKRSRSYTVPTFIRSNVPSALTIPIFVETCVRKGSANQNRYTAVATRDCLRKELESPIRSLRWPCKTAVDEICLNQLGTSYRVCYVRVGVVRLILNPDETYQDKGRRVRLK